MIRAVDGPTEWGSSKPIRWASDLAECPGMYCAVRRPHPKKQGPRWRGRNQPSGRTMELSPFGREPRRVAGHSPGKDTACYWVSSTQACLCRNANTRALAEAVKRGQRRNRIRTHAAATPLQTAWRPAESSQHASWFHNARQKRNLFLVILPYERQVE